jgi:hypothetical protein
MRKIMENKILSKDYKKIVRIIFNVAIMLFVGLGVVIDLIQLDTAMALSAFTVQSNILCLIAAGWTIIHEILKSNQKGKAYIFFKGMTLTAILLTFLIVYLVLKPYFGSTNQDQAGTLADILLHLVVPLMMLGDFLFFEEKGNYKIWFPFAWTAFPLYYVGYTAIYKAFGGMYNFGDTVAKFPYFFLDYETYGLKMVGIWFLMITIGFIGFSYLLVGIDRIFVKINKVKNNNENI